MKKILLNINRFFKSRPHPFNMQGVEKLNYYNFEYDSSKEVFAGFEKLLGENISVCVKNKRILDLGCGAGGKSVFLFERGASSVAGIDLSEILIDQGNKEIRKKKLHEKVVLKVGDVTNIDYPDEQFDLLIANDLMEHVGNPVKMLDEAFRVLKPGGFLLINFEPYFHFLGHHMWDQINIPWAHLLFSEKTRIEAYKELVSGLPDEKERLDFRLSKNDSGEEYIGYLNHITYYRYLNYLVNSDFAIYKSDIFMIKPKLLKYLAYIPFLREPFIKKVITVLKK